MLLQQYQLAPILTFKPNAIVSGIALRTAIATGGLVILSACLGAVIRIAVSAAKTYDPQRTSFNFNCAPYCFGDL